MIAVLPIFLLALAVLIAVLLAKNPPAEPRLTFERNDDLGDDWRDSVPRAWIAPDYLP